VFGIMIGGVRARLASANIFSGLSLVSLIFRLGVFCSSLNDSFSVIFSFCILSLASIGITSLASRGILPSFFVRDSLALLFIIGVIVSFPIVKISMDSFPAIDVLFFFKVDLLSRLFGLPLLL